MQFSNAHIIGSWAQGSIKSIFEEGSYDQICFKLFLMFYLTFPENGFNFITKKLQKHWKFPFPNAQTNSFLTWGLLKNHLLKSSLWPNSNLIGLEFNFLLSQKMVSTSLLKNLQKTEKCPFQALKTFVLELTVASKPFSKKLPVTQYWFD